MPRYDFCCTNDHLFEVVILPAELRDLDLGVHRRPCPACGGSAGWKPSSQIAPPFRPHWNEHLGHQPVYVESREHFRRLLLETDSYGPYLEPGSPAARTMIEVHDERRAKERQHAGHEAA